MWSESDVIANEMCALESSNSVVESASRESKLVMEKSLSVPGTQRDGFKFTWRIENFSSFGRKTGEYIQSPTFCVEILDCTEWFLRMYPRGDVDSNYVACYLYRKKDDCGPDKIAIGYSISFMTADGSPNLSGQVDKLVFEKNKGFGNTKFKKRDDLLKRKKSYLPKDVLTVRCYMWKCFLEKSVAKECFACTRLDVERNFLKWSIKNFSAYESGEKQDVPFTPASTKVPKLDIKWYMDKESEMIRIEIVQHGKRILTTTYVNCVVSLVDFKGNHQLLKQTEHFFDPLKDEQVWQLPPLIEKSLILTNKDLYLPEDTLCLTCELTISIGEETSVIEKSKFKDYSCQPIEKTASKKHSIEEEFLCLYHDGKFCDVTLRTPRQSFKVHRIILMARSLVFRAMLETDNLEEHKNVIHINDVDENTLSDMLIFIYSNRVEQLNLESAIKLYCAADKYQVISLTHACTKYLKSVLTVSNVCLLLALVEEHKDVDMKSFIQEFICNNASSIFQSRQWKDFMEKKANLAAEMMHVSWKGS